MPDKGWKKFERRIAALFPGGVRRGADTRSVGTEGKTDVIAPGWAIECKLLKTVSFQILLDAALQAEKNSTDKDDIPVAIVKEKGKQDKNALVVVRWPVFMDFFNPRVDSTGWGMAYYPARRPVFTKIVETVEFAEGWSKPVQAIPVAKVEKYGTDDVIAVMKLASFSDYFIN